MTVIGIDLGTTIRASPSWMANHQKLLKMLKGQEQPHQW